MRINVKRSLVVLGCALLLASPFIWNWVWPAGLLGSIYLIYLLSVADKLKTKSFLGYCYLFGLVYMAVVLGWVYKIHTTELVGDTVFASLFIILTFFLMVTALSTGFLLFGLLYRLLHISTKNKLMLVVPLLWGLGEYFRSIFFSVFSFGDGGSIGPFWNFGVLGFGAMNTPLKYAARIVGLYGTSMLILLIAIVIFQIIHKKYRYGVLLMIPLLISSLGWSLYSKSSGIAVTAGAVSVSAETQDGYQDSLNSTLNKLGPVDLLALPEYSYYFTDSNGVKTQHKLPSNIQLAVDSSSKRTSQTIMNNVSFYNNKSQLLAEYQKSFLIPGGEYIPYIYHVILFYSGNTSLIREFKHSRSVEKAPVYEKAFTYNATTYGSLACSGAIAPSLYGALSNKGAQVLTNSASISTLGVSPLYYKQASQMSAFTAIANARPFVQSARGGPSYILNKDGIVLTSIEATSPVDITTATITTNNKKTPYSLFGEWTLWISLAGVAILSLKQLCSKVRVKA